MPEASALGPSSERAPLESGPHQQSIDTAAQTAHIGFWDDLVGSFTNGLKSQENGLVQLSNRVLGTSFNEGQLAVVDDPSSSWSAWTASLAGQAGVMAVELFAARKLGAVAKLCLGKGSGAEVFAATQTAQSKMAHSLLFGAGLGGLATPTNDSENFWRDRFFNTVSSSVSIGAMSAASIKMELAATKLGVGTSASFLGNAYFNNAVGGIIGGSLGELTSQSLHQQSLDWKNIGRAGVEFGLVGAGAHGLTMAGAGAYGRLAGKKAETKTTGDKTIALAEERTEARAEDRLDRFPLSPEARPLVEKVVDKFKIEAVTPAEIQSVIESFPKDKQSLVVKILEHSLPNSSEVWFADRMKALKEKLDPLLSAEPNGNKYFAEGQASEGQALAFLYRKFSNASTIYLYKPEWVKGKGEVGIIFDDLSKANYSPQLLTALKSMDRAVVVDFNGFETGVNFLDYAIGPKQVAKKIASVLEGVKQARQDHPNESDDQLIARTFKGALAEQKKRVNAKVDIINADDVSLRGSSGANQSKRRDTAEAARRIGSVVNTPFATTENVTDFLRRYVPDNQAPLAYIMSEGTARLTWKDLANNAQNLHEILAKKVNETDPASATASMSFVDSNVAKSGSMVNYLYRQANDVPRERFGVNPPSPHLVFLDDKIYSGQQMGRDMGFHANTPNIDAMYAATLVKGYGPQLPYDSTPKAPVYVLSGGEEPKVANAKQWVAADEEQLARAKKFESEPGMLIAMNHNDLRMGDEYGSSLVSYHERIVLPYGVPDNDIPVIRDFSHRVLGSQAVNVSDGKSLSPALAKHVGERTNNSPERSELIELGDIKVDMSRRNTWDESYKATITRGQEQVAAKAWMDDDGYHRKSFEPGNRLISFLNLSSYYPKGAARTFDGHKWWVQEWPADIMPREDFPKMLKQLSGNAVDESGRFQYSVLKNNGEIRQQLESAYLEQLVADRSDLTRVNARLSTEGRVSVFSDWLSPKIRPDGVPSWGSMTGGVEYEFAMHQISDQNYGGLRNFYQRYLMDPAGIEQLRTTGYSAQQIDGIRLRAEWFLEKRRFPGMYENG